MSIRNTVKGIGLLACAASLTAQGAVAETFVATSSVPPTHWLNTQGMEPLMDCIRERSEGEIDFDFFPAGQIASTAGALDAVTGGLAQLGMIATSANSDRLPLNQITMLPDMGDTAPDIVAAYRKVMAQDGPLARELAAANVLPLTVIYLPPYQIGLKGPALNAIGDFDGLKVRVAGGGQVFGIQALDGVPVQISSGDAYVAMQQGTVDGFLLSLTSVVSYSLQEVSSAISTNGNFANAQTFLGMDQRVFDSFTPERQAIYLECGKQTEDSMSAYLENLANELKTDFAAQGVEMFEFTPELWAEVAAKMQPVATDYIERMNALGLPGQEAYDEYRKALGK
ncbi:TRAP transporter substrate-binding protein DctP [Antarctobacter sp.]|uniref:TRAP transporter substrate-binding protein n=1 Tax=Antarctobacter sp. TaxID=1872577 RepID=UPI003A90FA05